MYSLPQKLRSELQARFEFTQEFKDEQALFHPMIEGRLFICIPPPLKAGLSETLIRKALDAKCELVVLLLPCDTSTEWFHQVWNEAKNCPLFHEGGRVEIEFLKGRLKWEEDKDEQSRWKNRVASCLVIIRNVHNRRQGS